jgi:poly-gamma-glutamate synthesis protein (capsule biosynthesis protein)
LNRKTIALTGLFLLALLTLGYFIYTETDVFDELTGSGEEFAEEKEDTLSTEDMEIDLEPDPPPEPEYLTVDMTFFGDLFVGRRIHNWSQASELKYKYPFSGLDTFNKGEYDNWIANLECPVTKYDLTDHQQEVLLKFNCKPEYLPEASEWFEVFSLANNHTMNMNEYDGLNLTRQNLENNSIQYFGHYDNAVKKDLCEVVSLNGVLHYDEENTENAEVSVPVALCGYHGVFKLPLEEEIAVIEKYAKHLPVFVMPHQGAEYVKTSDQYKRSTFRSMIDYGADAVVGGHPHTVQEAENYKDKLIVYSLGNFIFDQQGNDLLTQGIALETKMTLDYNEDLRKLLELDCTEFKDKCVSEITARGINKPTYTLEYDIIPTNNSNKLAKKGSEKDMQDMLQRTNFKEVNNSLRAE